jgi:hypothetical protein
MGRRREDPTRRLVGQICSTWNVIEVERGEGVLIIEEG